MPEEMDLVSTEDIRGDKGSFNVLIFRHLDRIDIQWSTLLSKPMLNRQTALADILLSIRALETLMWARLSSDPSYKNAKVKLGINTGEFYEPLKGNNLASQLKFAENLDKWEKLITRRLDKFNFFPPVELSRFTNTDDLDKGKEGDEWE